LGKNGEPKQGIDINLSLSLDGYYEKIQTLLSTDEEGKVTLG